MFRAYQRIFGVACAACHDRASVPLWNIVKQNWNQSGTFRTVESHINHITVQFVNKLMKLFHISQSNLKKRYSFHISQTCWYISWSIIVEVCRDYPWFHIGTSARTPSVHLWVQAFTAASSCTAGPTTPAPTFSLKTPTLGAWPSVLSPMKLQGLGVQKSRIIHKL